MKKIFTITSLSCATFLLLSSFVFAQASAAGVQQGFTTFAGLISAFNNTVVKALGTLILSAGVVAFFYGVVQFIWGLREGKEAAVTAGKQFMIWALVGLFVMFSVYGIIQFFQGLIPGLNNSTITIPDVNYGGSAGGASGANTGGGGINGSGSGANTGGGGSVGGGSGSGANTGGTTLKANGDQCTFSNQCSSGYCESTALGSQCATQSSGSGANTGGNTTDFVVGASCTGFDGTFFDGFYDANGVCK